MGGASTGEGLFRVGRPLANRQGWEAGGIWKKKFLLGQSSGRVQHKKTRSRVKMSSKNLRGGAAAKKSGETHRKIE